MEFQRGRVGTPTRSGLTGVRGEMMLDRRLEADGVGVSNAMFAPGARTDWHSHVGGQFFLVTGGRGMVASRDGDCRAVQPGDVVYAPPGEVHWHGAAHDAFLIYTAVSLGDHEWFEQVTDEEWAAAWRAAS
jgi:quercetin dioxygenase-like cupin family protein